jgi:dTDP-4-dehydrorhamnose reductase
MHGPEAAAKRDHGREPPPGPTMARIVVTGAAGMLGTALIDHLAGRHDVVATGRAVGLQRDGVRWSLVDLRDDDEVRRLLLAERPDLVVHAAAIVDVDQCERDPLTARQIHARSTELMCRVIAEWDGAMIYISTDSVFDGQKRGPYDETDPPAPQNTYSRTKLEGEAACLVLARGTVLRTNIFGWSRAERTSFAEWVLRGLVDETPRTMFGDVTYTPIHVTHLSEVIEQTWDGGLSGLFHAGGSTMLTKHAFAIQMADVFGLSTHGITEISIDAARLAARRPRNTALSSAKISWALNRGAPSAVDGLKLMRNQYDDGWVARVKQRPMAAEYHFWEVE